MNTVQIKQTATEARQTTQQYNSSATAQQTETLNKCAARTYEQKSPCGRATVANTHLLYIAEATLPNLVLRRRRQRLPRPDMHAHVQRVVHHPQLLQQLAVGAELASKPLVPAG